MFLKQNIIQDLLSWKLQIGQMVIDFGKVFLKFVISLNLVLAIMWDMASLSALGPIHRSYDSPPSYHYNLPQSPSISILQFPLSSWISHDNEILCSFPKLSIIILGIKFKPSFIRNQCSGHLQPQSNAQ